MASGQGYSQEEGIDYDETYAPIARLEAIRMLLAFGCSNWFNSSYMTIIQFSSSKTSLTFLGSTWYKKVAYWYLFLMDDLVLMPLDGSPMISFFLTYFLSLGNIGSFSSWYSWFLSIGSYLECLIHFDLMNVFQDFE